MRAAAQERALAACRVYRDEPSHVDADVCRFDQFGPLTFKGFHVAEAQLGEARAAFARHDAGKGGIALAAAARFAHDTDRTESFSNFAERIVREVTLLLEEHGGELDAGVRRAIVADARLEAAARPFERERVNALWVLSQYHRYQFEQDEPAATGALADEMEADEPAFHEMTDATLAGDIPRCEQAAARLGPLVGSNAVLGRVIRPSW